MTVRSMPLERKRAIAGRMFVYPWVVGFLIFYLRPLIMSIYFTLSDIAVTKDGFVVKYSGFKNYVNLFVSDQNYVRNLITSLVVMLQQVPLILIFSLFVAVILNQEFRGRFIARSAFFLPVVLTSGALVYVLMGDLSAQHTGGQFTGGAAADAMPMISNLDFGGLLLSIFATNDNLYPVVRFIVEIMDQVFIIIWKSGVQILIFLAGLQSINSSVYEAADVEGATGWEKFWKITFPMISPIIVVNVVYTTIDSFTDYNNAMLRNIVDTTFRNGLYAYGSTMAWVYFIFVIAVVSIIIALISRNVFYMND